MNTLEWIAAALGVANIALLVRRSVWNFPFGLVMVSLYAFVFWEARLYGEAGLQLFYIGAQGWGWWLWLRAGGPDDAVPVRWLDPLSRAVWIAATAALSLNLGWIMHRFTDATLPYADSAITGASIAAQILLGLRRVENWVLWIVIDLASIAVYLVKGLHATAGLYVLFLVLSVMGLREWVQAAQGRTR